MKPLFSRFRPSYITKLAYMLQASEYRVLDYLSWVERVHDFSKIGRRQQLIATKRTQLLLTLLWMITAALLGMLLVYVIVIFQLFSSDLRQSLSQSDMRSLLSASVIIITFYITTLPWAIAYIVVVPVFLGRVLLFKPYEWLVVAQAKRIVKNHPAMKIAIAGSFGKTTLKEILKTVLSEGKIVAATTANFNTLIGISRFVKTLTGKEDVLIFEFGEYRPGDVKQFCKLTRPDVGIITGVNEAHLSQFKSVQSTAQNIFTLAKYVKPSRLYINEENELARKLKPRGAQLYSRRGVGGWKVSQSVSDLRGTRFTAQQKSKRIAARSKLLGIHNIGPLILAIDLADKFKLGSGQIEKGIAATKPFEHRLQPYSKDRITILDDTYNGNPAGVTAGLEFVRQLKAKRVVYVTPGLVEMGEQNQAVHEAIGHQLAKVADVVMLIKNISTPHIEAGLKQANFKGKLLWFENPTECYESLELFTKSGDVVLLQNDWPEHYL